MEVSFVSFHATVAAFVSGELILGILGLEARHSHDYTAYPSRSPVLPFAQLRSGIEHTLMIAAVCHHPGHRSRLILESWAETSALPADDTVRPPACQAGAKQRFFGNLP